MPEQDQISAEPTKAFFVDMLTRDIALEQALLDLVDNSVDGAKAVRPDGNFDGLEIRIEFGNEQFRIRDNCGGFDRETAKKYAFRFGRPSDVPRAPHSIGQFGVGMKRALFKFGAHFKVRTATPHETWAVEVDVPEWEQQPGWVFPWADFVPDENVSLERPGVEIVVTKLRPEVASRFATSLFKNSVVGLIRSKHRQFISQGLRVLVNGDPIIATNIFLLVGDDNAQFSPGVDQFDIAPEGQAPVRVRIIVGLGASAPKEAGWYVICNGRVILEADRRQVTGWGLMEEEAKSLLVPNFHNQYARFRGIVAMDSDDSSRVPWNTTKTDVDQDSPVWQETFGHMVEMMRPVIGFLNELDRDIDEHTIQESPLFGVVTKSKSVRPEDLPAKAAFKAPARGSVKKEIRFIKVQYLKPIKQVEFLQEELGLGTAKAVGETTFQMAYERFGGK